MAVVRSNEELNKYAESKAPLTGTGASGTWEISVTGNAATATKLSTARTLSLTGAVSGNVSFDGSANVNITTTVADDSHNHVISNVDGLQAALDSKADKVSKQSLDSNSALRVSGTTVSLYKGDGTFDSITTQDTIYTLPNASATVLGGIKVGTNLSIDANGVLSANDTNVSFTEISNKPTNLSGYGITDAYTKTEVDTMIGDIASALDTINGQVI